jgi:hypothetical protein
MTAFAAQAFFQHDIRRGVIDASPSFSGIQDFLCLVVIDVTGIAVRDGVDVLDYLVLDIHVALVAFDFVLRDMFCVHQIGVFVFFQSFPFSVALVTILPRDLPIAENGVAVTFIARKTVCEDQGVVVAGG